MKKTLLVLLVFMTICFTGFTQESLKVDDTGVVLVKVGGEMVSLEEFLNPVGTVEAYIGASAPAGWLLCDGSEVSRTTYARLFTLIGTTYGSGDGSTTFNLPDLRGQFLRGLDAAAIVDVDAADRTDVNGAVVGAVVGSKQDDQANSLQAVNVINSIGNSHVTIPDDGSWSAILTTGATDGPWISNRYQKKGVETRPTNVAVNYIIKY